jgi:class 3 adenylate cyclase
VPQAPHTKQIQRVVDMNVREARPAVKRKIAAIVAADIAGYSRLVAQDEEETLRRLAMHRAVLDDFVARWGGRVFNTAGDGALAEFPSSVDAVRCAVDIQDGIRARNLGFPPSRQMFYRIGITVADVVERDGDLLGDGVNIAARLGGLATPGGICVSRAVYEQVANKVPVKFEDLGQQQVKNMPAAIHAYSIAPHSAAADLSAASSPAPTAKPRNLRLAALAIAGVVAVGLVVTAWQLYGVRLGASLVGLAGQPGTSRESFGGSKIRALAASQGIPLPPNLKVMAPAPTLRASLAGYLGAWGGDQGWNGSGRHVILVIESVDESGTALGIFGIGPPPENNADRRAARYRSIAGSITDAGLVFMLAGATYTFRDTSDGLMWGRWQVPNERTNTELTITLQRID